PGSRLHFFPLAPFPLFTASIHFSSHLRFYNVLSPRLNWRPSCGRSFSPSFSFAPSRLGCMRRTTCALFFVQGLFPCPFRGGANLPVIVRIQRRALSLRVEMNTWHKRDWKQFYELARRPWQRHRPPRPVYPTGLNRVLPAAGFSLSELDDAGVDLELAERLGLPVDAGRIGAYGPNVTVLRDFVRSSRQPV